MADLVGGRLAEHELLNVRFGDDVSVDEREVMD
jgi:hypothetical protein